MPLHTGRQSSPSECSGSSAPRRVPGVLCADPGGGPVRATVVAYLNAAVAVLAGVLVLDESFDAGPAAGGGSRRRTGRRCTCPGAASGALTELLCSRARSDIMIGEPSGAGGVEYLQ